MGCNNSKQHGETDNHKRRATIKKVLGLPSRRVAKPARPMSYAGNEHEGHSNTTRPLSMFDAVPFANLDLSVFGNQHRTTPNTQGSIHSLSRESSRTAESNTTSSQSDQATGPSRFLRTCDADSGFVLINKSTENLSEPSDTRSDCSDEHNWKYYLPLNWDKIRTIPLLKEIVYQRVNDEFIHVFTRLERIADEHEFIDWFVDELEFYLRSSDDLAEYQHPALLLRAIEQDRFECMRYVFEHQLLPSKLDINAMNDQGRHCLLMLAHRNGPIDSIQYLLTRQLPCLDTNKLDLNAFSSLHHTCRHFNLELSRLLLPHTSRKLLQIENSELHTPLDYWIECLCSLKKLKPTQVQHHSDTLRLDYLLNDADYHSSVLFFQAIVNQGGQLTKLPLRYIRSVLPQLTFEQKLSYVDHHVHLCCTLYKNRLSTLLRDYDSLKVSIQAGEVLTEFIFALGTVQLEVQNRLAAHAYSSVYETAIQRIYQSDEKPCPTDEQLKTKEHDVLQMNMRMLYFKFFRLFQCIYNNPDVNEKNFQFEHIFRRVWIYWKEPVRAFIGQCREKNSSLKALCRICLFKRLKQYPADIQHLPINTSLKQFLTYDNPFFVVRKQY